MRAREFIVEYRRDITTKQYGPRLIQRWTTGIDSKFHDADNTPEETLAKIYDNLEIGDPTPTNKYVPWLAREYALGNIRSVEDIVSELYPLLQLHNQRSRARDFPEQFRDIMRVSAQDFYYGMEPYKPAPEELVDRGDYETIINNSEVRIIHPKDETAACYYGQGTRWCTASTESHNFFDAYNRKGPLYILLPKEPQYKGERYQIHFATSQWMDQADKPVDLADLMRRFPSLENTFFKEHEEEIHKLIEFMPIDELDNLVARALDYGMDEVDELVRAIKEDIENNYDPDEELERNIREAELADLEKSYNTFKNFIQIARTEQDLERFKTVYVKRYIKGYGLQPLGLNIDWFINQLLNTMAGTVKDGGNFFGRMFHRFKSRLWELQEHMVYQGGRWWITD